jgi:c-di-GMP-binding flagellar brake protein YcgR
VPCEVDAIWVEGPVRLGDDEIVIARMAGAPRRMQRREAVRVPVSFIVRASLGDDDAEQPVSVAAVTENLSAGGALLRMAEALDAGTPLTITLQPPGSDGSPMDLPARVVRSDREPGHERPWRVALAFDNPTRAQQESIVRYIFRLQREWRARETGMHS